MWAGGLFFSSSAGLVSSFLARFLGSALLRDLVELIKGGEGGEKDEEISLCFSLPTKIYKRVWIAEIDPF